MWKPISSLSLIDRSNRGIEGKREEKWRRYRIALFPLYPRIEDASLVPVPTIYDVLEDGGTSRARRGYIVAG